MNVDSLLAERIIESVSANSLKAIRGIRRARRDLSSAQVMLKLDEEWAYTMAYHGMLRAGRALMSRDGYRPRGSGQHRTVVRYISHRLGDRFRDLAADFDRMRRKRNDFVYESEHPIPHQEAEQALKDAQELITTVESLIRSRR